MVTVDGARLRIADDPDGPQLWHHGDERGAIEHEREGAKLAALSEGIAAMRAGPTRLRGG